MERASPHCSRTRLARLAEGYAASRGGGTRLRSPAINRAPTLAGSRRWIYDVRYARPHAGGRGADDLQADRVSAGGRLPRRRCCRDRGPRRDHGAPPRRRTRPRTPCVRCGVRPSADLSRAEWRTSRRFAQDRTGARCSAPGVAAQPCREDEADLTRRTSREPAGIRAGAPALDLDGAALRSLRALVRHRLRRTHRVVAVRCDRCDRRHRGHGGAVHRRDDRGRDVAGCALDPPGATCRDRRGEDRDGERRRRWRRQVTTGALRRRGDTRCDEIPAIAAPASGTPERRRGDQTMTTNDEKDLMRVDDRTQERVIDRSCARGICRGSRQKDRCAVLRCRCARTRAQPRVQSARVPCRLNGEGDPLPDARVRPISSAHRRVNRGVIGRPEGDRPRRDEGRSYACRQATHPMAA